MKTKKEIQDKIELLKEELKKITYLEIFCQISDEKRSLEWVLDESE